YSSLKQEVDEVEKQHNQAAEELSTHQKNYEFEKAELESTKTRLDEKREHISSSEKKLNQGFQMIARLNSRKEVLQEMKEEFQGFYHGVRSILKATERKELNNIHGAVVQLINVPEEYVYAIETVLGGQSQHVVVKNEEAARTAINWLKKSNNGRATFLPLTSIQPRYITDNLLAEIENHQGFINIAASLVKVEASMKKVVDHL